MALDGYRSIALWYHTLNIQKGCKRPFSPIVIKSWFSYSEFLFWIPPLFYFSKPCFRFIMLRRSFTTNAFHFALRCLSFFTNKSGEMWMKKWSININSFSTNLHNFHGIFRLKRKVILYMDFVWATPLRGFFLLYLLFFIT